MEMKRALITGITGQDGSYLAQLLMEKGYVVHGMVRQAATIGYPRHLMWRLRPVLDQIQFHSGSLESLSSMERIVRQVRPDECYHLAAQSFVGPWIEDEYSIMSVNTKGTHHVLSAIREWAPA